MDPVSPYDGVMKVANTGSFMTAALSPVIPVPRLLGSRKKDDVIPVWNGFVASLAMMD